MFDIRLRGLAGTADGTNRDRLEQLTGFNLRREGNDWIIPGDDPNLVRGPSDILRTTEAPLELNEKSYDSVATEYIEKFLVQYFEERHTEPKDKVSIYGDSGFRTEFESIRVNFFLTPPSKVRARLIQETFPFVCSENFGATAIAPITVNANYQQAIISISKILAILEYGGVEKAKAVVGTQGGLNAALPTPLDFLSYVESLNTMAPSAISIPIHRIGSSLHLMRGRPWFFPKLFVENIFEQILAGIEPLSASEIAFFTKDQHLQKRAIHSYFICSIEGVNRLSRFLNDFRTFANRDGNFDPMQMAKAHSVIRLMFSDWQSINFSNSRYIKLRMVFAFLDKLANLLAIIRGKAISEEDSLFKHLSSMEAGVRLARMLQENFGPRYHGLGRLMSTVTLATYKKIHEHIATQLWQGKSNEENRLKYLRTLRNSAHGSFLKASQFEEVFLATGGTICMEFTFLPLLLLWGLVSDPKRFLEEI